MTRARIRSPSAFSGRPFRHDFHCDVVQGRWPYMEPHQDWTSARQQWVDASDDEHRSRRESRNTISSPQYPNYVHSEGHHPQSYPARALDYRSPVLPSTYSREDLSRIYQPAPRCASQPNTHDHMREGDVHPEWLGAVSPLRRRSSENESQNDMDYQLFVEATSGLSPDASHHLTFDFQNPRPNGQNRRQLSPGSEQQSSESSLRTSQPPEPIRDLSMGRFSTQSTGVPPDPGTTGLSSRPPHYYPLPAFDSWQRRSETRSQPQIWQQNYDADADEDELPDYEQSQAEMQDRKSQEAKRRAEELQMRWKQRHSR